ncbi:MAG: phage virion morphogenesis protein [Deltaproteobacteria bacterium]|nr:phage virion morphogenesis protein [Deltaproteobacteria bacterium]
MAGVRLTLDTTQADQLFRELERVLKDTGPLLQEVGEIARSQALDAFEAQASPAGEAWQPSRRAEAEGGQTLLDTGLLRGSLFVELAGDEVWVGSNRLYAAIHQFGGQAGRGRKVTIPARPYMPDEDSLDLAAIEDAARDYLAEALP